MRITYLEGNALEPIETNDQRIIVHCVNCMGVMGSGIARAIKDKWKIVYSEYYTLCKSEDFRPHLLGTAQLERISNDLIVCNLFGQFNYGVQRVGDVEIIPADYRAVKIGFANIKRLVKYPYSLHMPRICCGRALGQWSEIERILHEVFDNTDLQIYIYDFKE